VPDVSQPALEPGGVYAYDFPLVNPGTWVMHCHNLYHMAAGMMTTLTYIG
jgi:FtsP/CotA-like multicopper oxidase with cupredoxin domain